MARHKDATWNLKEIHPGMDGAILAALMDIRDELKEINRKVTPLGALSCPNLLRIPHALNCIIANTAKPKRTRKPKA